MQDPKSERDTERWERPRGPRLGGTQHQSQSDQQLRRPNESQRDRDRWLDDGGQSGYRDTGNHPKSRSSQYSSERHLPTDGADDQQQPNSPVAQEYGGGQVYAPPYSRSQMSANLGQTSPVEALPQTQSYRGYGPQNYIRADDRVLDEVHEQLTADHQVDARHIDIRVASGVVSLTGRVSDKAMKYRAEEIAERVAGVKEVDNRIKIEKTND